MRIFKSTRIQVFVVMLFIGAMAASTVYAQPSIPRRYNTTKKTTKKTSYSSNTVWGTQYDWLSQRYATYNDIRYKDAGQIRVLKNSIYARHGYIFKDSRLRSYFNSLGWYSGWRSTVPSKEFNKYESSNIKYLGKYDH